MDDLEVQQEVHREEENPFLVDGVDERRQNVDANESHASSCGESEN
jgi:hypothetical protein